MALAQQFNVRVGTIQNWEYNRSMRAIYYLTKLIEFLGYDFSKQNPIFEA